MVANHHTCCICEEPRHPVEIHHIDFDPSKNDWNNLAVVCRNCHGLITAKSNLGSNYTPNEVLKYKHEWEKRCAESDEEEIESPTQPINETKLIRGNNDETYDFDMEKDDELVFSVDADGYLDVVICSAEAFEEWVESDSDDDGEDDYEEEGDDDYEEDEEDEDDEDDECSLPESDWVRRDVANGEYKFGAPEDGNYVLLLINRNDDPVEVTVDAAVWPDEE